jgi:hypothetical protein
MLGDVVNAFRLCSSGQATVRIDMADESQASRPRLHLFFIIYMPSECVLPHKNKLPGLLFLCPQIIFSDEFSLSFHIHFYRLFKWMVLLPFTMMAAVVLSMDLPSAAEGGLPLAMATRIHDA